MDDPEQGGTELTHSQMQIWVGQRLSPESPLYNMAFAWIFEARLDLELFQRAWRRVAGASDVLGTRVVERDGAARLRRQATGSCVTEVIDLGDADGDDFRRWCRERCARPLDASARLVDSVLVPLAGGRAAGGRAAGGRTGWYLSLHHLISDAWSTGLLYRQVAAEYAALAGDAPEPARLADYYPAAEALAAKPGNRSAALEHWASRLERPTTIPLYGRPGEPGGTASTRLTLQLDEERSRALDRLCGEEGFVSLSREMSRFALFATLLASWLHRVSGRLELGFDAPVSGRPTAESKRALGLFIEMFPFAVEVSPHETFRSLGAKCLAETELFLRHALPGTSSPSGAAAGNVVLNYIPEIFGDFAGIPAEVEWVHPGHGDGVHALRVQVHDFAGTGRTTLHFDFNESVLPDELRRRGLRHFEKLLAAMLADPDTRIAAVDVLTGDEQQALARWNGTAAASSVERTVVASFLEQVEAAPKRVALREARFLEQVEAAPKRVALREAPKRVALREGDAELSFAELEEQSAALAGTLARAGVGRGDRVGIVARRSIEAVVAVLATLRAGAAYVPIDPAYPRSRQRSILEDSGARLVLHGADVPPLDWLGAGLGGEAGRAVLPIAEGIRDGRGETPGPLPALDDLAYVLFTSGSTGRPKGVAIEHRGLAEYLAWAERLYVRGERLRFPLFTSLSFDLTVTSLFLPLITGGSLEIYPEPDEPVDSGLIDVIRADAVDFLKLTPSHLSLLLEMKPASSRIRRMVVGGEDFKTSLASRVVEMLGSSVEITNEYGPTEAVVGCVAHRFDPAVDVGPRVPIGVPADGVRVEVLGSAGAPVAAGVPGELWVSRPGLARGYLGRARRTAECFLPDPTRCGERRYRTGDRVRMLDGSGGLEYLGRLDRQLKISGHRIEPAEIEAALAALPGIERCAVVARRRDAPPPAGGEVHHCRRCGLPSNHPRGDLGRDGVCGVCRSYEAIATQAQGYFKTLDELRELFAASRRERGPAAGSEESRYDCLMLLSGGKDSTYALCQLVEMGLSVYAFTLDNGFISDGAKENVRRVTRELDVPVEFGTTPAMNAIFRDSLRRFANVCQGCFKTIYTLSTQRAKELGIPIVVTGLSRGQMFETRLTEELFAGGGRTPEEVDAAVLAARRVYHRLDDEVSRSLDVEVFRDDRIFEEVRFVDFYRYCDVGLSEMLSYLGRKVPWVRPEDTGRSTNCLINDLGIFVHQRRRGFHNYALPYSWDVRMGHKTRQEALAELDDEIDLGYVRRTLAAIGCDPDEWTAGDGRPVLAAYYVASREVAQDELRRRLAERLPTPMIPTHWQRLEKIPLTVHGKVDSSALPSLELDRSPEKPYRAPDGPVEEFLAEVFAQQLGIARVGGDDGFFELGGTSLGAMEVMIRLCREFDVELPLETLFSHPTLTGLARVTEDRILEDVASLSEEEQERLLAGD